MQTLYIFHIFANKANFQKQPKIENGELKILYSDLFLIKILMFLCDLPNTN